MAGWENTGSVYHRLHIQIMSVATSENHLTKSWIKYMKRVFTGYIHMACCQGLWGTCIVKY